MSRVDRTARVLAALGTRISEQGDMHIRVSRRTMRVLLKGVGLTAWEAGYDEFREIDALALDAMRHLAVMRLDAIRHEAERTRESSQSRP